MSLRSDALLAVTGIFPKEITSREHVASHGLPDRWSKRMAAWVKSEEAAPFDYQPPPDMDKLFEQLAIPPPQAQVDEWLKGLGIEDPELQADYWLGLTRAREYAVTAWPKFAIEGPAGTQVLPLSYDDAHEMWSIVQVLDDPDRVLDEMACLLLTTAQANAFRAAYPDLAEYAIAAGRQTMIEKRAKDPEWGLDWEREAVWRTLLGLPPEATAPVAAAPIVEKTELKIDPDRDRTQAEVSSAPKGKERRTAVT